MPYGIHTVDSRGGMCVETLYFLRSKPQRGEMCIALICPNYSCIDQIPTSRLSGWTQTNSLWDNTDQNRRIPIGQVAT